MHRIMIYYKDGFVYQIDEESEGKAHEDGRGISTHDTVDHVEVWLGMRLSVPVVVHFLEGYALP